jgi:hypothetical protein
VLDALNAVAERARTMSGVPADPAASAESSSKLPAVESSGKLPAAESSGRLDVAAEAPASSERELKDTGLKDTREDGVQARVARMSLLRWIGASAAAAIVIVGTVAAVAAVRSDHFAKDKHAPLAAALATDPRAPAPAQNIRPTTGEGASDGTDPAGAPTDDDGAPMVMDLPDTPGHTGGTPRSRGKPGAKPQRPKFLNSRE